MSQAHSIAHARGWNLATTLMVCITVFQASNGEYGLMPSAEYDVNPTPIIHEFDPFSTVKERRSHPAAAEVHRLTAPPSIHSSSARDYAKVMKRAVCVFDSTMAPSHQPAVAFANCLGDVPITRLNAAPNALSDS